MNLARAFFAVILGICLARCNDPGGTARGQDASAAPVLQYPLSIAALPDGSLVAADNKLHAVVKIDPAGNTSILHQAELKFGSPLYALRCVAADAQGTVYVGDSGLRDVFRLADSQPPQALTRTEDGKGLIEIPMGVATAEEGELFVTDLDQHCVWRIAADGAATKFAAVTAPSGLARDSQGNLWVTSRSEPQVVRIDSQGAIETLVEKRLMRMPHAIAVDDQGVAYVADGYGRCIWRLRPGQPLEKWVDDAQFVNPTGLAWRGKELIVADPRSSAKLFQVSPEGSVKPLN